jgi:hypothetical protein
MIVRCAFITISVLALVASIALQVGAPTAAQTANPDPLPVAGAPAFTAVELWIDSGDQSLAAYQLEFKPRGAAGTVKIVGIEGGDHALFAEPPYYDPRAMQGERVVIADLATAPAHALPKGRFRIATIHVQVEGNVAPEYDVVLSAAADADGTPIHADIQLRTGGQS